MSKKTNFIILTTILFIAFTLLNAEVQNQPENPYKISFLGNIRNDRVIGSIIWGDSYLFDDDIMAEEIIALHDEWIVVAYNDDSAPNYGKARCRLGEVNGTEINWGSEKTFADYCYIHFSIAPITGNKFVVAYLEGTYLYVRIGEGDGVDDIDFYDIHEIGYNANSRPVKIKHLSETKYVVVNGDKATIVTADLYSNTLSNGSSYAFVSNETNQLSLSVLSSTKFVVFYQNYPSDNDGYARVGTVSGTSITFGNTVAFNTTGETEYIESAGLNSGKVVVTYSRHTSNGPCVVKIGNISGTNITFSEEHIYNNNNSNRLGITRLSDSKFIVSYCPSYAYAKSKIGEISGSDITWSEESSGLVNIRRDPSFAVMNDTKIVLIGESFYYNDGYSYIGTIVYPMEFIDHDADQVTDETLAGKQDQHIQRVEFETDGDYNPLILAQLGGDTNGTTDYDNDIDRIKVYYTGLDDTFSPIDQFGSTIENPDYNWNFYGSQELAEGINYFWICYDINETADAGNYLDVRTLDFTLEGEIQQNFSGGDPSGHREIIGFDRLPGNMLELDGIDDYVSVPLVLPDNGTIELWYYPDSLYNYNTIFDNSLDANDWEMWIYETGELKFRIENDGFVSYDLNNLFGAEHWYHIALSWNKHDALVDYNLYINGDLKDSETDKTWLDPGVQFYLGGGNAGNTNGKGIIDEIQIWKISKTAEQIRESIHKGNNGWTDGLIAKWQFNDSSGNTVTDLVNDYEATLNNMTDDDWITSNIPFGKGYSNSRTEQSGLVDFGSSNLDMDYTTHNSAEITATMINLSPNTLPSVDEVYDNQYWVVNRYGTGSFDADMIFEPSENIDSWMEANPDYLKLFTRTGNAIDEWIHLVNASSAEASSNKVTFDNITDLSQFIICGINFPEISSTIPDDDETDTDWSSRVYIEFDKDIFAGTGNLILKKASNDSTVATVSASSVTINGSSVEIDFGTQLEQSTSYYIQIDNDAFIDDYNIYFSGIDDNTTWNFTTGAVEVIPGTGVEFDGIDDYENVGSHSSLDISGGITIECWVKPQAHSDWARIIAAPSSFNGKYVLSLGDDEGEFAFAYQEGVGTQRASISFQPYLTMNEWNHITCTSDGTQNGNRLYVNGVQVFRSEADDFGFSGTDVWLGCKQNNTRAFNGCIDEMRIWNTIRTEEEIRQYMCLPLNGDEAGLVSYW
ncbi:MAG: Ig-like domain-containing protein, partial [Candidatus Cloacimonetes bacterium]|nr:Ig-like domain-containing protein [Candidatus Cloacimonadota bacterium]